MKTRLFLRLLLFLPLLSTALLLAQDKTEWFGKGINAFQQGLYGEATVYFTRAIELDSMNHIFWFNRATCYVKLREYERAVADLARTIELDPRSATAYMQLAVAHAETRQSEKAIIAVSKAIELDSTLPKTHYLRGRLYLDIGDTTSACVELQRASQRGDVTARALQSKVCEVR